MPPKIVWAIVATTVYSAILLGLLLFRVPYAHLIYLVSGGCLILLIFLGAALIPHALLKLVWVLCLALIGGLQIYFSLNLWPDFSFKERRISLQIDQDATSHTSLYLSARNYAKLGLWGKVIIHLRQAIALSPSEISYRIHLIQAYLHIEEIDLAKDLLTESQTLAPKNPHLQKLSQVLAAY